VEQGRRLQHLPGALVEERVDGERREQRQGQLAHLFAVLLVGMAGAGEVLDGREPVAPDAGIMPQAAFAQGADDQPLADAALVDAQQVGAEKAHQASTAAIPATMMSARSGLKPATARRSL